MIFIILPQFVNILHVLVSNDLDGHKVHGLVVHAFEDLSREALPKHLQDLIAVAQVVIDELWIQKLYLFRKFMHIYLSLGKNKPISNIISTSFRRDEIGFFQIIVKQSF